MAATTYGTAYLFGTGGVASASITGIITNASVKRTHAINELVEDGTGVVVASRHDDLVEEIDLTFRIATGYTRPTVGAAIVVTGSTGMDATYRITEFTETRSSKSFIECKVTAVKYSALTVS